MAKKSASSVKVKAPVQKVDNRKNFQEWKEVEQFTLDAAIEQAKRIDTWVSMRADYADFAGRTPEIDEVTAFCREAVAVLEEIKKRFNALTFEEVASEDYEDCLADMIVRYEDCKTLDDFFRAYLSYGLVKQWAPKVFDVRRAIKQNYAACNGATE